MCGIAGILSPRGIDSSRLGAMADAIRHRGPDGEGYLLHRPGADLRRLEAPPRGDDGVVGFAHRRLSIIDLSERNDQPAVHDSGELALIFNGEIYNYVELRGELQRLGHEFATSGDTEVLLASYAEWGPACIERLVGMWAFALLDLRRRTLLLSRDRFGIKPLYYRLAGGELAFASEIKALLAAAPTPEPDEDVVRRFLLTGAVDEGERTFFEGIRSLPPAHSAEIRLDHPEPAVAPERYWSLPGEGYRGGRSEAAAEFASLLRESVRVHARSDVPVGTCLSGGLDSSAIVCVAELLRERREIPSYAHRGFGYVPDDPAYSERRHMDEVVRRTGLEMTYVDVSPERFASALVAIADQQDEPFGSTSIAAQWFVFEAAREAGVTVMLDGQGADETLLGYHSYFPLVGLALLRERRPVRYLRFAAAHRRRLGRPPQPWGTAVAELSRGRRGNGAAGVGVPAGGALFTAEVRARVRDRDYSQPDFGSVHELLAAHTTSLGLPALLRFEDRNSMAHSIEARVPFLDHRLVEFVFRLPPHYKLNGLETKSVLREGLRGVLPEAIRTRRDKVGFRAEPTAVWRLAESHRAALAENRTDFERRWLDRDAVERLLGGADRTIEAEFQAWRVINLKLWLRRHWGGAADPLA